MHSSRMRTARIDRIPLLSASGGGGGVLPKCLEEGALPKYVLGGGLPKYGDPPPDANPPQRADPHLQGGRPSPNLREQTPWCASEGGSAFWGPPCGQSE